MKKILIVEDEAIVSLDMKNRLERMGYDVVGTADSSQETLELARDSQPDLVLMDIHIQGDIDGIETSVLLRKEMDIPVVFLTAYSDRSTMKRAQATGPFAYILKPFKDRELDITIEIALYRHQVEKELQAARGELELRVQQRTTELAQVNEQLRQEIAEHQRASAANAHLEEQLRQSQKMEGLGQLAGGIAHDFNNMLTIIKGYSELVLGSIDESATIYSDVQTIGEACQRATALTSKLLTFGRRQPMSPETFELNDTIRAGRNMLDRVIGEHFHMETTLHAEPLYVHADPTLFDQALINLVVNARDAMPDGGQIDITTEHRTLDTPRTSRFVNLTPGEYALLSVSDVGVGMDEEVIQRIFEPFYTTKQQGKGTGLGLSMVYSIIEQSKGQIDVRSEPGVGTTFDIYLPLCATPDATEATEATKRTVARTDQQRTVLVVEDEDVVRSLATRILSEYGFEVLTASSGAEALTLVKTHGSAIDLLLTDVVMAGMSGHQLAQKLSNLQPSIDILYMSGHGNEAVLHHGIEHDDMHFLQKPFSPQQLIDKVHEALAEGANAKSR